MSDPYWLTEKQMKCLRPSFPKSHGRPRLDDRRVLSGIVFMNRNGLCWQDAPWEDRPHRILRTRWKRWSVAGILIRLIDGLAAGTADHQTIMNDATSLRAHRTASSLRAEKGMRVALIG